MKTHTRQKPYEATVRARCSDKTVALPVPVRLAADRHEFIRVNRFLKTVYPKHYPSLNLPFQDPFDEQAFVLYTEAGPTEVTGCLKLVPDGSSGLPEDKTYRRVTDKYRALGLNLMEARRFSIAPGFRLMPLFLLAAYRIARATGTDVVMFVVRSKDYPCYRRLLNAQKHEPVVEGAYGSIYPLLTVAWHIQKTPGRFFKLAKAPRY